MKHRIWLRLLSTLLLAVIMLTEGTVTSWAHDDNMITVFFVDFAMDPVDEAPIIKWWVDSEEGQGKMKRTSNDNIFRAAIPSNVEKIQFVRS